VRTRAAVAAREGEAGAGAEAEATTMTVRANKPSAKDSAKQDAAENIIDNFKGCAFDETAHAEIAATLAACAARQREQSGGYDDPEVAPLQRARIRRYGWVVWNHRMAGLRKSSRLMLTSRTGRRLAMTGISMWRTQRNPNHERCRLKGVRLRRTPLRCVSASLV
jgi:hypothetical protein